MTVCIAEMPSYTYAVKGEKLLKSRGYTCEIKRNENTAGGSCGYSLDIHGNCRKAKELLDNYAVPYSDFSYGGE